MQREISHKVSLRQTVFPYNNVGRSSSIDRTWSNYNDAKEKVKKKIGNWSILSGMMKISRNTSLVSLSLNRKVCLKTSILGKRLLILPTLAWKNLVFKYCLLTTTVLTQIVSTSAFLYKLRKKHRCFRYWFRSNNS